MREHRGVAVAKPNIESALCEYLKMHHKGVSKTVSSKNLEIVLLAPLWCVSKYLQRAFSMLSLSAATPLCSRIFITPSYFI